MNRRTLFVGPLLALLTFACGQSVSPLPSSVSDVFQRPKITRVVVVVLENENLDKTLQQPFFSLLASRGALMTNYHGITHPSQPNYLALVSGSTQGVRGDSVRDIDARTIVDLLDARHLDWRVYAEGYPGECFLGSSIKGKATYVRRHVPMLDFTTVTKDPVRCAKIVGAERFDTDVASGVLPPFSLYIPDNSHNGHDTGIVAAGRYMQDRFGTLLDDQRFMEGTLFVVTFDESEGLGSAPIFTALAGPAVKPGARSDQPSNHYTLLRTIEDVLDLGNLGLNDSKVAPIGGIWK